MDGFAEVGKIKMEGEDRYSLSRGRCVAHHKKMFFSEEPPLIIAAIVVDEPPPETDRVRRWINEQGSRQGSCHISGGETDIQDDFGEIQEAVLKCGRICQGEKTLSTIYRVPPEIYSRDRKAYEPKAICIGPFFYRWRHQQHLESMQNYKWVCVYKLMSKPYHLPMELLLQKCWTKMKEMEVRVRSSYSKAFPSLKSDEFTLMLILDGCFLLLLLLRHKESSEETEVDDDDARQVVGRSRIGNLARYDLLLLQNQIPFFVIQSLYDILEPDDNNTNLVDCAINLFSTLDPCRKRRQPIFCIPVEDVHHLLHLIYSSVLPCPQDCESSLQPQSSQWIPSATELQGVGIKFKKRENTGGFLSFLDIRFYTRSCDAVIEIPQLKVHDYSVSLLRNLIAFEQCYPDTGFCITVYAAFMKLLINTKNDMRLLRRNQILINNMTGDKDATQFFSHLCSEIHHAQDRNYLRGLYSDVTAYYDSKWHKWRARLVGKLFENPWPIISTIVRVIARASCLN